jgi:sorbitol-specific phosphotransferase system component IIA
MNKLVLAAAIILALASPLFAGEHDHAGHGMNYGNVAPGKSAHQEVVDGVKATFNVQTMKDAMKSMGMEMPKGVKETHHISVSFNDMKTGKAITTGEVMVKVQAPDKSEQTKEMPAMHGHFGADFELAKKGKYGVMCKFKLPDGKVRSSKFWYEVK